MDYPRTEIMDAAVISNSSIPQVIIRQCEIRFKLVELRNFGLYEALTVTPLTLRLGIRICECVVYSTVCVGVYVRSYMH